MLSTNATIIARHARQVPVHLDEHAAPCEPVEPSVGADTGVEHRGVASRKRPSLSRLLSLPASISSPRTPVHDPEHTGQRADKPTVESTASQWSGDR